MFLRIVRRKSTCPRKAPFRSLSAKRRLICLSRRIEICSSAAISPWDSFERSALVSRSRALAPVTARLPPSSDEESSPVPAIREVGLRVLRRSPLCSAEASRFGQDSLFRPLQNSRKQSSNKSQSSLEEHNTERKPNFSSSPPTPPKAAAASSAPRVPCT